MKLTKSQLRRLIEEEIKSISESRRRNPMVLEPLEPLEGLAHAKEIAKNLRIAVEFEQIDPARDKELLLKLIDLVLELE